MPSVILLVTDTAYILMLGTRHLPTAQLPSVPVKTHVSCIFSTKPAFVRHISLRILCAFYNTKTYYIFTYWTGHFF
jgi:hypothetical protein